MTIRFLQNSKDFEPPDDMFHRQSDLRESSVIGACGVGERVMLAGLFRRPGERVLVLNPLIPSVGEEFRVGMDGRLRLPQESKIMRRPAARSDAEDLARDRMHQELHFQRVALLLPAVPVPLLFLGRSHGTSLTSTTTAANTVPASFNVFFPGREKRLLCSRASSTRTTVRNTVVSWTPQS